MGIRERVRCMWLGSAVLLVVMGMPAAVAAQGQRCPDGDDKAARVDVEVDVDSGRIAVDPESIVVYLDVEGDRSAADQPNRVCWVVSGLPDGHRLRFEDKGAGDRDLFPGLYRVIARPNGFANSGRPSRVGTWQYGLRVENMDGKTVAEVDPQVIVRSPTTSGSGSGGGSGSSSGSGSDQ